MYRNIFEMLSAVQQFLFAWLVSALKATTANSIAVVLAKVSVIFKNKNGHHAKKEGLPAPAISENKKKRKQITKNASAWKALLYLNHRLANTDSQHPTDTTRNIEWKDNWWACLPPCSFQMGKRGTAEDNVFKMATTLVQHKKYTLTQQNNTAQVRCYVERL